MRSAENEHVYHLRFVSEFQGKVYDEIYEVIDDGDDFITVETYESPRNISYGKLRIYLITRSLFLRKNVWHFQLSTAIELKTNKTHQIRIKHVTSL